jgi:hypothetical protein
VFDDSPSLLVRIIGKICLPWFYGHGWFAPIYYGALIFLANILRDRYRWVGDKPIWFFVVGVSAAYGALCALLISLALMRFTASGGINWIFIALALVNLYAIQALTRCVLLTCKNQLESAAPLLKRGLIMVAPSIFLLIFFAAGFADTH